MENNRFTYKSCFKYSRPEQINVNNSLLYKLNDFTEDYPNPMARILKYKNSPIQQNPEYLISPKLNSNQGSVLKNLNDYKVEESFNVDEQRLMKYRINRKPEYNILSHENIIHSPLEIKLNKWSKYHEK